MPIGLWGKQKIQCLGRLGRSRIRKWVFMGADFVRRKHNTLIMREESFRLLFYILEPSNVLAGRG